MKADFSIRVGKKSDLDLLPDLENRADQAYADLPGFAPMLERPGLTIEQCHNLPTSAQIWMAERSEPVGFVFTRDIDDLAYLGQICVVPEAQRKGIGTALMNAAIAKARADGKPGIVLATYSDVVFNGPYYAKHGFKNLIHKDMGNELLALSIEDKKEWGCFSPRVIMGRFFSDD